MNKIQNIKVLFWDIDNTLLDFDAGAEDSAVCSGISEPGS